MRDLVLIDSTDQQRRPGAVMRAVRRDRKNMLVRWRGVPEVLITSDPDLIRQAVPAGTAGAG